MNRKLTIIENAWRLKKPFIIARGKRTEAKTLTVSITQNEAIGRGECVPYARYGESFESVIAQIETIKPDLENGLSRKDLQEVLPAGAARNAVDAALWDLDAKLSGRDVGELSGLGWPSNVNTVQTISILSPAEMGKEAARLRDFPVLKVKLDSEHIIARISAVHEQAPQALLLVDANESWSMDILQRVAGPLASLGVVMIEQPLKVGEDDALSGYDSPVPIYADESCHTRTGLTKLKGKYDGINIKLDKTGGLTEAIALLEEGRAAGFEIMLGCMLGSSLAMAPAMYLAGRANYVDLDGPALLAEDRTPALEIDKGVIAELPRELWGG